MSLYKEIVTKAVIGKGKKYYKNTYTIDTENPPTTVLGCWVINNKFKGSEQNDRIIIDGSFDVNIWYSYDNDTKTEVSTKTINYTESVSVNQKETTDSSTKDIIVRSLKQPSCSNAMIKGNSIVFDIEKELGIEIVGDTKVKVAIEEDEDPWDDNGGLVINLYPGQQHMDGSTAITYVRYRDEEGDIGRITRQQKFMKAVMDKLTSPSIIPRIPAIIGQVVDSINTDLSVKQMIDFMAALKEAQSNGLQTEMLPGRPMYIGGVSYWIPDLSKLRATVANTLDVKISPDLRSATQREMLEYENSVPDDAQEIPMDEATMHKLGLDRYNEDIDSAQSKDKKHSSSKEKYTEDKEDLSDPYRDEEDTRGSKIPDKEPRENSEQNLPEAVEPAPAPSMSLPTTGKTSN